MAGNSPTQLPAYIQLRYEENGVFERIKSGSASAAETAKRNFNQAFTETEKIVTGAVGRITSKLSTIDLGVGDMRQQSVQIKQYRDALSLVATTAERLARETGDTTRSTQTYIAALKSQASEAGRVLQSNEVQIRSYARLQAALDRVALANRANRIDTRSPVQRLVDGDASIDRAAIAGTRLEQVLGRVSNKGREVTQALNEAARAAAQAAANAGAIRANPAPLNSLSGVNALVAGQASIDRAALSGATLEGVLGRLSQKSITAAAAQQRLGESAQRAALSEQQLAAAVDRLNAELNPAAALTARYDMQVKLLNDALARGVISQQRHAEMTAMANSQYRLMQLSTSGATASTRSFNIAMLQSGQQLQDIGISLYSGQRAAIVFAQQIPQLAFALSFLQGSANKTQDRIGRFATFLSGPWGLAVGLAVGATVYFATKLLSTGDAAEGLKRKTINLGDALAKSAQGTNEARKALIDYNNEQNRARDNSDSMIKVHLDLAEARLKEAQATRELLQANLAEEARAARSIGGGVPGYAGTSGNPAVAAAAVLLKQNQADIDRLSQATRNLRIQDAGRDAEAAVDPIKKINNLYDDMAAAAKNAAAGNDRLSNSLKGTLTDIEKRRAAAIKAQREATKSSTRGSGLFGNEVDLAGASAIARKAGFTINSGFRTRAEQQRLYDTVRTPQNPVAKPGTSAHERSNALDIAFGAGVTPASIKKAFADEGVRLTKILKESGHFHIEWSTKGADKAQREADALVKAQEELADWGARAAEGVQRINERFNEQPRFVDQADAANRQLVKTIDDLNKAMSDPNATPQMVEAFKATIAEAEKTKGVIQESLVRPFKEMARDSDRRLQIQTLLSKGREDEADALQEIWSLEKDLGPLTKQQRDYVTDIVQTEKDRTRELDRQKAIFDAQLNVINTTKESLKDVLSGRSTNLIGNIRQSLKDLQGQKLFDSVFGNIFDDLERELRGQSPLGKESQRFADEMSVATDALSKFNTTFGRAANDNSALTAGSPSFNEAFASILSNQTVGWHGGLNPPGTMSAAGEGSDGDGIVVTPKKPFGIDNRSIINMADKISGAIVDPLQKALSGVFGTGFGQQLGAVMKGALSGYLTGGATGGVLGGLKSIVDQSGVFGGAAGGISAALGKAGSGAATGSQIAGIGNALGIKTSTTGAQLGGAVGSFIPIPGGDIIGSIAGGLLGNLFKKSRSAGATVTQDGTTVGGKDKGNYSTATGLGDSVTSGLKNIVDQLGGTLGNFAVTIGTRGDSYRVNTTGSSLKTKNGAVDFGDDQEAAIRYAIMDAINDGAVQGIRESTKRILKAGDDLDQALQDALDWENVFKELKKYKDPIGAALDELNAEFEHYIEIAKTAGASTQEMADLEELYGIKRNEIIKEQAEALLGSLKDLYQNLTVGDSGLSLRDRRANALTDYNALAARVAAGDTTAYDDYADAAQTLLDIEREMYGSQQAYFDRLNEVTALTKAQIDKQTSVVDAATDSDSPFDSTGAVKSSIDSQTDVINSQLTAVNDNLGTVAALLQNLGVSLSSTGRLNFASSF